MIVNLFDLTYVCRYYGVIAPSLFGIMGGIGFCILNSILGGQALATVANISWT
jgi:purine-cytosine permease-like protein